MTKYLENTGDSIEKLTKYNKHQAPDERKSKAS